MCVFMFPLCVFFSPHIFHSIRDKHTFHSFCLLLQKSRIGEEVDYIQIYLTTVTTVTVNYACNFFSSHKICPLCLLSLSLSLFLPFRNLLCRVDVWWKPLNPTCIILPSTTPAIISLICHLPLLTMAVMNERQREDKETFLIFILIYAYILKE